MLLMLSQTFGGQNWGLKFWSHHFGDQKLAWWCSCWLWWGLETYEYDWFCDFTTNMIKEKNKFIEEQDLFEEDLDFFQFSIGVFLFILSLLVSFLFFMFNSIYLQWICVFSFCHVHASLSFSIILNKYEIFILFTTKG